MKTLRRTVVIVLTRLAELRSHSRRYLVPLRLNSYPPVGIQPA
ncbi:MAG: hypothetical protein AAGG51_15950 [Cyanobacteria bacterium P01_G01_bin.54]